MASRRDANVEVVIHQVAVVETFSPPKERGPRIYVYLTNLARLPISRLPTLHSELRVPQFGTPHCAGCLNSHIIQDRHGRPFKYPLFFVLRNIQRLD